MSLRAEMLLIQVYRALYELDAAEADKGMRFVGIAEAFNGLAKGGEPAAEVF